MLQADIVLSHCSKIVLKNDPTFNRETSAFRKQKAFGEKLKVDEETKERAMYKGDTTHGPEKRRSRPNYATFETDPSFVILTVNN